MVKIICSIKQIGIVVLIIIKMQQQMIHKIHYLFESAFLLWAISWQPFFGSVSAIIACVYYLSKIKMDVVDKKYDGSWKLYIKSILKLK